MLALARRGAARTSCTLPVLSSTVWALTQSTRSYNNESRDYAQSPRSFGFKAKRRSIREAIVQPQGAKATTLSSYDQLQSIIDGPAPRAPRERSNSWRDDDRLRRSNGNEDGERRPFRTNDGERRSYRSNDGETTRYRSNDGERRPYSSNGGERRPFRSNDDGQRPRLSRDDNRRQPRDDWVPRSRGHVAAEPTAPYMNSLRVKKWIARHPSPLSVNQAEELVNMVADIPVDSVNAAVWNLVFALLGKEGKYLRMWKAFNAMKKRGTKPTSRTFTTLINAYAGLSHSGVAGGLFTPYSPPEQLTLDRVRILYEQSQAHIQKELAKMRPAKEAVEEDLGIAFPGTREPKKEIEEETEANEAEVNVMPTNSYLKFLGRFGMWEEMERIFLSMDRSGPLAPDQVTYWTMLKTANNIDHYRRAAAGTPDADKLAEFNLGATARSYWDQAVRQMCKPGAAPTDYRELDKELAIQALQCFSVGRPEDQTLVEILVPRLWALPRPGAPSVASATGSGPRSTSKPGDLPAAWSNLPQFGLDVKTATSLMSILGRMRRNSLAAHYTTFILERPHLQAQFDLPALRIAIHNFSAAQDVDAAVDIIDKYQPPTGSDGWPMDVWHSLLSAARWSANWETALKLFSRMAHMPGGIERGFSEKDVKPYAWSAPNGEKNDYRGRPWIKPRPYRPDTKAMTLLLKTALASGIKPMRQASAIYNYYGVQYWFTVRPNAGSHAEDIFLLASTPPAELGGAARRAIDDRVELAKDLETISERILEHPMGKEEEKRMHELKNDARAIVNVWGRREVRSPKGRPAFKQPVGEAYP